ncbi:MAG: hypothetical protein GYB68_18410 [Chloroflexi bacterium]|nr:hypothetical protein [Chloroflexota bacterium]
MKRYTSDAIDVTFDVGRCIHAEECVHGLAAVFDTSKRPWIQPQNSEADVVAEVIHRCPSGALQYERHDGGPEEPLPGENTISLQPDGPLYLRGDLSLLDADGNVLFSDTRMALCRCGASQDKPFCDNSHKTSGFQAAGDLGDVAGTIKLLPESGVLHITPTTNGPIKIEGAFEILSADGETLHAGNKTWLCRCGGSSSKPFCDGTHNGNGFTAD